MRFDVATRILGWMLIVSSMAITVILISLAVLIFGNDFWRNELAMMLAGILFAFAALPQLASGLLALRFADLIRLYRLDPDPMQDGGQTFHSGIRLALGFCGFWLVGILGLTGMGLPKSIGTLAIAGVMVLGLSLAGPQRMARWSRG